MGTQATVSAESPIPQIDMSVEVEHRPVNDGHGNQKEGGLPQFDPYWFPSQIFWLMLTFGVMYLAFSRKILPSIAATIDNREQHTSNDLEMAERFTQEANDVQHNYEAQLANAKQQAHDIMLATENDLKEKADQQNQKFTEKSLQDIADIKTELDAFLDEALTEIEGEIAEISTMTAQQIAGIESSPKDAKSVVKSISKPQAEAA